MSVATTDAVSNQIVFGQLSAFQRDLLSIMANKNGGYGLGLKEELESLYGSDVTHGQLYSNLDDLVEMDLVEKSALDKRTNQYKLTNDGETVVQTLANWFESCLEETGGEN